MKPEWLRCSLGNKSLHSEDFAQLHSKIVRPFSSSFHSGSCCGRTYHISFQFLIALRSDCLLFGGYITEWSLNQFHHHPHVVEGSVLPRNECSIRSLTTLVNWLISLLHNLGKFLLQCPHIIAGWCKVIDALPCEHPIDYGCQILFHLFQHHSSFYSRINASSTFLIEIKFCSIALMHVKQNAVSLFWS